MRDATREMADSLHLLRLSKRLLRSGKLNFGHFFGRDVPAGAIHKVIFLNANPGNPTVAAIFATIAIDEAERGLADQGKFEAGPCVFHIVRVQQFEDRHAGDLCFRPAQDGLPRWIGSLEISLGIERSQQIGAQLPCQAACLRALDHPSLEVAIQLAQAGFRRTESNFRGVPLGHVRAFDKYRCHIA